ncbi:hypothetical protein BT69DRAFT_1317414 [Atractiella rhizophila]|nr:hypothetical protein BT69DRAFT_1317414 [Atractiella rhizophila]
MSYNWTKPDLPPRGLGPMKRGPRLAQKPHMPLADKIHRTAVTGLFGLFLGSTYYLVSLYWNRRQQRLAALADLSEEDRQTVYAGGTLSEEKIERFRGHQERRGVLSDAKGSAG